MDILLGKLGTYFDALGKAHPGAQIMCVKPSGVVNVAYTEGGTLYADCNVGVTERRETAVPPRFWVANHTEDE